ncbi:helix-turn-helix transcriptional regulator [Burkholderia sp. JP2-270]|uniref:helix-turn-helix transcriptional regulator n=1 Tax=Burkholderia sp. JP2-270 TaxID=2217913 RepID=UPI000DA32F0D|nr:helix-turn-helix transcriptional regulator [Burkholderia sp. JP2-270]AWV03834.1 helix-turn-helix transcriptional regulator [Burkholderia sp. JP2-270]
MAHIETVHAAIQHIYDAVLSPQRWEEALAHILAVTKSDRGFLLATESGTPALSVSSALDEKHACALQRELQTRPPAWMGKIPAGVARRQSSEITDAAFRRTYIYNEVVRPERMFYGLILPILRTPDREAYLTVGKRLGAADYNDEDESATVLLVPHLTAALDIRSRLAAADIRDNGALEVLIRLDVGVILLDENARPLFINPYAEELSRAHDGLLINHRGVSCLVHDDAKKLQLVVSSALEFSATQKATDVRRLRAPRCFVHRSRQHLPLVVRVVPVTCREPAGGISALARVILFVIDPERTAQVDCSLVAETFSLTPREAELATLLARGENIAQAALQMNIGLETARAYLKIIQGKTQTHRQAELVSLLLRSGLYVIR